MATTYMELCNQVLRQLNEVELTSSTFATTKGIHAAVRDAVRFTIDDINSKHHKWPFNIVEDQSKTLTAGTEVYAFESDYKIADWNSFYIYNDGTLNTSYHPLGLINRDQFLRYNRGLDEDSATSGRGRPDYVFPWYGKFGVTKSPDKAYTLKYNYWKVPTALSAYDDQTTIPSEWDRVILLGTMWYGNLIKEDEAATNMAEQKYMNALLNMRTILINENVDIVDSRINYGTRVSGVPSIDVG